MNYLILFILNLAIANATDPTTTPTSETPPSDTSSGATSPKTEIAKPAPNIEVISIPIPMKLVGSHVERPPQQQLVVNIGRYQEAAFGAQGGVAPIKSCTLAGKGKITYQDANQCNYKSPFTGGTGYLTIKDSDNPQSTLKFTINSPLFEGFPTKVETFVDYSKNPSKIYTCPDPLKLFFVAPAMNTKPNADINCIAELGKNSSKYNYVCANIPAGWNYGRWYSQFICGGNEDFPQSFTLKDNPAPTAESLSYTCPKNSDDSSQKVLSCTTILNSEGPMNCATTINGDKCTFTPCTGLAIHPEWTASSNNWRTNIICGGDSKFKVTQVQKKGSGTYDCPKGHKLLSCHTVSGPCGRVSNSPTMSETSCTYGTSSVPWWIKDHCKDPNTDWYTNIVCGGYEGTDYVETLPYPNRK